MRISIAVLTLALTAAAFTTGCSKLKESPEQRQADLVSTLKNSLQLWSPDFSYTVRNSADTRPSGANVQMLMNTIIDPVAGALKESTLHLSQTIAEGQRSNGSLEITDGAVSSSLLGTRDDAHGTVSWTYKIGSATVFTGSQRTSSGAGEVSFPTPSVGFAFTVHFDLQPRIAPPPATSARPTPPPTPPPLTTGSGSTGGGPAAGSSGGPATGSSGAPTLVPGFVRHLTIIQSGGAATNLGFTFTFDGDPSQPPSKVEFTGSLGGRSLSGSWDVNGGRFVDQVGTTRCFNGTLQDITCN